MKQRLHAGQSVGDWIVTQVLDQNERSGLYRVLGAGGSKIIKEILLPSELSPEQKVRRRDRLLKAISDWRNLSHPTAIKVEEVMSVDVGVYLVLPELDGTSVTAHAQKFEQPPASEVILRWADELASLVECLIELKHPLALELLRPDNIMLDRHNRLMVFNPGWSKLIGEDNEAADPHNIQQGLSDYAKILALLATGKDSIERITEHSSADLLWILSRCLSDSPGRRYESFCELRHGLRGLEVQGEEAQSMRHLGALPPVAGFRIPIWQQLQTHARPVYALILATLIGLVWLYLGWLQPELTYRPAVAVSFGDQIYLLGKDGELRRSWNRFPTDIVSMVASPSGQRLYLALEGVSSLCVLETQAGVRHNVDTPASIQSLQLGPDGLELILILSGGRIVRMDLRGDREKILDSSTGPVDATQVAVVPLDRAASPQDHPQHMEGIVAASPSLGLVLLDATLGRKASKWAHKGISSVTTLPTGDIAAASKDGFLHLLKPDLSGEQSLLLPTAGACQLYAGLDQATFYTLQSGIGEGIVGVWKVYPQIALVVKIRLASPPQLATVDEQGGLWVITQHGPMYRIAPDGQVAEKLTPKLAGQPRAVTYLAQKSSVSGLDKLKDTPGR